MGLAKISAILQFLNISLRSKNSSSSSSCTCMVNLVLPIESDSQEVVLKSQYYVSRLSKYHLKIKSVGLRWYCKAAVSNLDIPILLYEHDMCHVVLVCTVPSVCKKCYILLKIELLHVKQRSKPSKIHSTGGVLVDLFNKTRLNSI